MLNLLCNYLRDPIRIAGSTVAFPIVLCICSLVTWDQALGSDSDWPSDPDYSIQGEFQGTLSLPTDAPTSLIATSSILSPSRSSASRFCGFQVVAKGGGAFDAVLFRGGFPGTGWDGKERIRFAGVRGDDGVILESESHGMTATMLDPRSRRWTFSETESGREIGSLRAIRRQSPTLGATPPPGAQVLFRNGKIDGLTDATIDEHGHLDVGFRLSEPVRDFQLHVEFRTPWEPNESGQQRGNSGVYIQRRYEVQILDSFGLDGAFNECGALYRQRKPDLNMALPPMHWQTYDIEFRAARFNDEGEKTENARISVRHNGVYIHRDVEIVAKTGAGQQEEPTPQVILFQDHRNEVRYRNLWIVRKDIDTARTNVPLPGAQPAPAMASSQAACDSCSATGSSSGRRRGRSRCFGWRLP